MVVDEGVLDAGEEVAAVPEVRGGAPHALHHLGRHGHGVALVVDLQRPVAHHVEQYGVQRRVARGLVRGEPARPDEHVARVLREVAVVLAVHEQQVHADRRRLRLEGVGDAQQHRHSRSAVVRAGNGQPLLPQVLALVRPGARVPMGEEEHALRELGPEAREQVPEVQGRALLRDVTDRLDRDGVGRRPQPGQDPVARLVVSRSVGHARPEVHLLADVVEGPLAGEFTRTGLRLTGERKRQGRCVDEPSHRICPTLVLRLTNAVITSWDVFRLACRSSFTRYAIWSPALREGGNSVSKVSCAWAWRLST